MRIALSAMNCSNTGISESYVAYNWVCQIARHNTVDLISAEICDLGLENVTSHLISKKWWPLRLMSDRFTAAVKPDYFIFDARAAKRFKRIAGEWDIFHHLVPQAPRYPSALGRRANRFVLGPIGGGLRVPPAFRALIEGNEPKFARLRQLDALRFRYDPWLRATYQAADVVLLTAPYMLDIIPNIYHSKVLFIPETGIDAEKYAKETCCRVTRQEIEILYVGRITPYKGLEFMLRAIAELPIEIKRRTLVHIVGDGEPEYERRCRTIAENRCTPANVLFHGRRSKDDVMQFYREADIFCFPTLAETTGNVLLEAMAMGLPVVSTKYGGPMAVVDRESGILVEPNAPDSFVNGSPAG